MASMTSRVDLVETGGLVMSGGQGCQIEDYERAPCTECSDPVTNRRHAP